MAYRNVASKNQPEFEPYAQNYRGGMENPIKRLFGSDLKSFLQYKVGWLLADLQMNPPKTVSKNPAKLLDFGCGDGLLLEIIRENGFDGSLAGCDVSPAMLKKATQRHLTAHRTHFNLIQPHQENLPGAPYDIIVTSCVFHHILPGNHLEELEKIYRSLKKGGRFYVFEHNPLNPLTQFIVRTTPLDQNAHLIRLKRLKRHLEQIAFQNIHQQYLLFTPTFIENALPTPVRRFLGKCPCGGQYVLAADKLT